MFDVTIINKCIVIVTLLKFIDASEFQVLRQISPKSLNLYPKIENFHPPKGYQPVIGYEPDNYKPNILNYFLNQKKAPADQGMLFQNSFFFSFKL